MSDETKEVNMTETNNENNVAETNNEMNELRDSNANLLAEQAKLMNERMQLQYKIKSLEEKLKDEESHRILNYKWYMQEQDKVSALVLIIKAMKSDSVTIDQIVERITKAV